MQDRQWGLGDPSPACGLPFSGLQRGPEGRGGFLSESAPPRVPTKQQRAVRLPPWPGRGPRSLCKLGMPSVLSVIESAGQDRVNATPTTLFHRATGSQIANHGHGRASGDGQKDTAGPAGGAGL